jgi:ATP-dependent helicase HrpB
MADLPIDSILPALCHALRDGGNAVLQAPPGAGKTTRVPLALLRQPWMAGQRILMLEPRRIAARAAATYMATLLEEPPGRTVGYRVRQDAVVGRETRVEVVTEGILTRMLQSDPSLHGVGLVIFDEFHERSIHADLALALSLQVQAVLREEMRILVMSATLEAEPVAQLLGSRGSPAPLLSSEGRAFPVETRYLQRAAAGSVEPGVARAVRGVIAERSGDVLVFLPGAAEIRRVAELLDDLRGAGLAVLPLHGSMPAAEQDLAISPSRPGQRKVVLATAVAETSLTIEGVRVVIDSGLMRVPRFSPRVGMTRLETVRVTRASADQRRGRAGRTGPGLCLRLWTEAQHRELLERGQPEIRSSDLAPLALELFAWGSPDPSELAWLDPPPPGAYAQAMELLQELGAIRQGRITPHGQELAGLGAHPRLGHMILSARELGHGAAACEIAALLEERDPLRRQGEASDADLRLRLEAVRRGRGSVAGHAIDAPAVARIHAQSERWRKRLGLKPSGRQDGDAAGLLVALAYPDRIARQRGPGSPRYLLRNGRGATLGAGQALVTSEYLAVAAVDDREREARILLAAPLAAEEIGARFGEWIEREQIVEWDEAAGALRAVQRERLGAIVLREAPLAEPDPGAAALAVLQGIRRAGIDSLPWSPAARQLQQRLGFLSALDPGWPDVSDAALLATAERWLLPHLWGVRRREQLQRLDVESILMEVVGWRRREELEELAPPRWTVPSGSSLRIDYSDPAAPALDVRLQEMFGLAETPAIGGGRVPLLLRLLSPAGRPVQVTRDLPGFWRETYFEVRKDLRGRYPKHAWPDDPLRAEPTRRARPRRSP